MRDFAAIDFETANNQRSSVCSVGVVVVRNGEIADTFYSLINPEPNYYTYWCSQVHVNPEKPDVPINKNDAFQKVQKRRVQEKR